MAGNLPVDNGLEVILRWGPSVGGVTQALNVLHFAQAPISATDQARADAVDTLIKGIFVSSGLAACLNAGVNLQAVSIRDMHSNTNMAFLGSGAPVAGTSIADPLPPGVSAVVTHVTGSRGRSFRGRSYLWGFGEDQNTPAGVIDPDCVTAGAAFFNGVRTAMAGAPQNAVFSVLSRFTTPPGSPPGTAAIERPVPLLTPVVSSVMRDAIWDGQRRRRPT